MSLAASCVLLLSAVNILAASESAQDADVSALRESIDLPTLVRVAVERSPSVRAARIAWRAAIERYPQVTALPDPMFTYAYFVRSVETRVGPQRHRLGFMQSFPYPGTLGAAGEVAIADAEIARARYEIALRDLIVDLKVSVHELVYLRRAADITRQNLDLLRHIVTATITGYSDGRATLNDLHKAQIELAQLSYDVVLLTELEEVERTRILSLLDLPTTETMGRVIAGEYVPATLAIDELEIRALAGRQEITIAGLVADKAEKMIGLETLKTKPMFRLELMTVRTGGALMPGTPDDGKDPWTVGLGVSVPWSSAKNESQVREATLRVDAALARKEAVERQTLIEIRKIYFRMENARRLVELYENVLIPQAGQAIEAAEQWNSGASGRATGLLETQTVWLNFNLARLRAVADYQQFLARMERLLGSDVTP